MVVNDELGALAKGLPTLWELLKPGGRLAVITFHSLEDQAVKKFGRERERNYTFPGNVDVPELRQPRQPEGRWVSRKAIPPTADELAENPRSRSAQLRVLERI
jgi:16S rRNA (cytosine1402-N4)-methyltransferase